MIKNIIKNLKGEDKDLKSLNELYKEENIIKLV